MCGLARTGLDLGNAPKYARHSESSGTDAGRQRVLGRDAGICTTWNFAALCRGDTPADVMESLIKELPRVIPLQNQLHASTLRTVGKVRRIFGPQIERYGIVRLMRPGGMRPTVPRRSSRPQCTAVQHRSTAVRTAYHVATIYPGALVATMPWPYPLSGFVVGAIVGLTGMGGGSLMTPLLIVLFGVHPLTAVGTDLLFAAVTKTAGAPLS